MKRRGSGILLHITSLPSPFGVGDLGPSARRFADFLCETRQSFWQVLPMNPTSLDQGNSPYSGPSPFAGNPLLISPELLVKEGFLSSADVKNPPALPEKKVNYKGAVRYKERLLDLAFANFTPGEGRDWEYRNFLAEHSHWLEDHALFAALQERFTGAEWGKWPREIRDREPERLQDLREEFQERIAREKFLQFLFYRQFIDLRIYCNRRGIQIIGDMPLYVAYNSPEVWGHPQIFKLDRRKGPALVGGVPPDYFSATGQRWGNPVYDWEVLKEKNFSWWVRRIAHNLKLFDFIRLDHFRGLIDYWEVPARERTAQKGWWAKGPGADFFQALLKFFPGLPLVAEDLGVITSEVHRVRDQFGLPGTRVLQFAFGNDPLADEYKPAHYIRNCVAYTGTHDNDTLMGWFRRRDDYSTRQPREIKTERKNALAYLGSSRGSKELHWEFIRLLMMSAANVVIFPLQDLLGLGTEGRMNRPGIAEGNWEWRFTPRQITPALRRRLSDMTRIYCRG